VRNLNKVTSQTSLLNNHKCRQSVVAADVFLSPMLLWMLIDSVVGFDQRTHTHTHAHSLSVSLLPCSLSPSPVTFFMPSLIHLGKASSLP